MITDQEKLIKCKASIEDVKNKINYFLESIKEKKGECSAYHNRKNIIEYEIGKLNLDIEIIECPVTRPLGTGEENSKLERLIRTMESKVKYLEGDLALIQGDIAVAKADIGSYLERLSMNIDRLGDLKQDLKNIGSKEFEGDWMGPFLKKARALKAEYTYGFDDK